MGRVERVVKVDRSNSTFKVRTALKIIGTPTITSAVVFSIFLVKLLNLFVIAFEKNERQMRSQVPQQFSKRSSLYIHFMTSLFSAVYSVSFHGNSKDNTI